LTPNCEARAVSTVPPQSLMLMNDQFVLGISNDLAKRLRRERPEDLRAQLSLLWELVYVREPSETELDRSLKYLMAQTEALAGVAASGSAKPDDKNAATKPSVDPSLQAMASLCQALAGSNRFLYLD
jgi:Protein of unknown function (DUF1553)